MASFHFSAQVIGRGKGHSAIAAAAYRAGARLRDEGTGIEHDYRRRQGVVHSEIMVPEGAAAWLSDREKLWNHVHAVERRKDAQLAREINVALPAECSAEERRALLQGFVREQFVARGMVADLAIHEPVTGDQRNHHAHILLTLRQATPDGLRRTKTREWNSDSQLKAWREGWADWQNRYLERGQHVARVDHRTLAEQRRDATNRGDRVAAAALDRAPEIHVGPRAQNAASRGATVQSQSRTTNLRRPKDGAWRSSKALAKRSREVDYRRIDRGTRAAFNAERGARAADTLTRRVAQNQARNARLRLIETRINRELRDLLAALRSVREPPPRSFWQKPDHDQRHAREALLMRRLTHVQRRSQLLKQLLGRTDRILSGLFQVHNRLLSRSRILQQRSLALLPGPNLRPSRRPGLALRMEDEG